LILEELAGYGVEVIFVNRSIGRTKEGELLLRMQSMIAEYEEAKTMERDRRMRLRKVRSGRAGAPSEAPYGFCRAEKVGGRQARYEVVEAEAEVVREIFRLLVDERYSVGQIARHLAGRKIPARGGKMWDRSAVWGILKNPIYTGRACFHGTEVVEGEKVTNQVWDRSGYPERLEPSYKDHLHEGCMEAEAPAIVSREIFQVAQAELDVNRRVVQRDNYRHLHLPRDVVVCRKCGYVTHGKPGWFISGSDSN
jgi:site-specific DNA recombinase